MAAKPTGKKEVNRSAVSGRFVTPSYLKAHPKITVKEHYRLDPKSGGRRTPK